MSDLVERALEMSKDHRLSAEMSELYQDLAQQLRLHRKDMATTMWACKECERFVKPRECVDQVCRSCREITRLREALEDLAEPRMEICTCRCDRCREATVNARKALAKSDGRD